MEAALVMRIAVAARKTALVARLVVREFAQYADETVQNEVMPCRHIVHVI